MNTAAVVVGVLLSGLLFYSFVLWDRAISRNGDESSKMARRAIRIAVATLVVGTMVSTIILAASDNRDYPMWSVAVSSALSLGVCVLCRKGLAKPLHATSTEVREIAVSGYANMVLAGALVIVWLGTLFAIMFLRAS